MGSLRTSRFMAEFCAELLPYDRPSTQPVTEEENSSPSRGSAYREVWSWSQTIPTSQKELCFISEHQCTVTVEHFRRIPSAVFKGSIPLNACAPCLSVMQVSTAALISPMTQSNASFFDLPFCLVFSIFTDTLGLCYSHSIRE